MKNKTLRNDLVVIVILFLIIGGLFFFKSRTIPLIINFYV